MSLFSCLLRLFAFGCWIESSLCLLIREQSSSTSRRQRRITTRHLSSSPQLRKDDLSPPVGSLGPPPGPLQSLQVGDSLQAFRRQPTRGEIVNHDFTVTKVAHDPPMFFLRHFLSPEDCQRIQDQAKKASMTKAKTITKGDTESRKHCNVAWLANDDPLFIGSITQATARMFLSPTVLRHPKSGVEDMQVIEYQTNGEFVLHHDGEPRILTIIYYLNGVAGTWFPLARTGDKQPTHNDRPMNKAEALEICQKLQVGQDGIVVGEVPGASPDHFLSVEPGDALAFYSYCNDGSDRINWNAIHAGLPVDNGAKWIANQWFQYGLLSSK